MNSVQTAASFFGASPLASATVLSLATSLVLLLLLKLDVAIGKKLSDSKILLNITDFDSSDRLRNLAVLLGLCLVLFCGLALVLSVLLSGFTANSALGQWDEQFVRTAHEQVRPAELALFKFFTELAGRAASILIGFGLGLYFLFTKNKRLLLIWSIGLIGNSIIIQVLKQFFQRPRPELLNPFLTEANFSFPSGHASASVLMFGLLAYIFLLLKPNLTRTQKILTVLAVLWLGVFIGTSRLVLGVHYPTDVLTGWLVASTWLSVVILADRYTAKRHQNLKERTQEPCIA